MRSFLDVCRCLSLRARSAVLVMAASALVAACGGGDGPGPVLQAGWMTAAVNVLGPYPAGTPAGQRWPLLPVENLTLRHVVRTTAGGDGLRVRISNRHGTAPLKVGSLHAARSAGAGRIEAGSSVALKFNGADTVTVPAGQEVWSDVASMAVPAGTDLAISFHIPDKTLAQTLHASSQRRAFAGTGNTATATELGALLPEGAPVSPTFWITGLDLRNTTARGTIVAIGDSITDGAASTMDAVASYPDFLARRVAADGQLAGYSVINAGIGGNRLLSDGLFPIFGDRLTERFARDALQATGVSHVIVLIGINDIGLGFQDPSQVRSLAELQAGLQRLVDQAKARGLKIYLGTLLPFEGARYYSAAGESTRQGLNAWIRANSAQAIGVVDFDAAVRDPAQPGRLLALYDSGDRLHPGDKGYEAMARAVDLAMLR